MRVDNSARIGRGFEKLCTGKKMQLYSKLKDTKAAFAERTMRPLKILLYYYMEDHRYKYLQVMTQFVETLNSGEL